MKRRQFLAMLIGAVGTSVLASYAPSPLAGCDYDGLAYNGSLLPPHLDYGQQPTTNSEEHLALRPESLPKFERSRSERLLRSNSRSDKKRSDRKKSSRPDR